MKFIITIRFSCGDTKILSNIKMSQNIMTRIVDVTKTKKKTVALHITHLMCCLALLLRISLQLVASYKQVHSIFACLHFILTHYLCSQSYRNHVKEISGSFKDPARVGLAVLKKIVIF